ncbi:MAG: T9SS type A sorting domain-containing protein [Chlorobi bacterium]|nr:T9SS type A sorting domain-containing protein [Chlorobiota bacterium]
MKRILTISTLLVFFFSGISFSQQSLKKADNKIKTAVNNKSKPIVKKAAYFDISRPLSKIIEENKFKPVEPFTYKEEEFNQFIIHPKGKVSNTPDPLAFLQKNYALPKAETITVNTNFDGVNNLDGVAPPDTQGDVSPSYYMQCVNSHTAIYNLDGTTYQAAFPTSDFWTGFGIYDQTNNGDAIILWDEDAQRWLVSQFAVPASDGKYYELVAVSTSADPAGTYYRYAFEYPNFPDYPKLAVWPDGYYAGFNVFDQNNGNAYMGTYASVYERDKMLVGDAGAQVVTFGPDANLWSVFPADADAFPTATGTPCYFMSDETSDYTGNDSIYIYEFHTDWTTPSNSTFGLSQSVQVTPYDFFTSGTEVPQSGVTDLLDLLHYRIMYRPYFRHFDAYNVLLMTRTVNDGGIAAVRWYELRNWGYGWKLNQEGTYNPGDGLWRWMPSIAMNADGDISIGYSISSGTKFPSIGGVGRYSYDPLNVMTTNENEFFTGSASQSGVSRWGDYSMVSIDANDDYSFWFTTEYTTGSWDWRTRIIHYTMPEVCTPPTTQASNIAFSGITTNSITCSWTPGNGNADMVVVRENAPVNQDPNPGTTYTANATFGSGSEIGTGTGNFVIYDGTAGTVNLSGLTSGQTYYFAVYTYNSATHCYNTSELSGNATTVGPPTVITTAVSGITGSSATSGGNVTSDNGSTVTARGVCWNTTGTPTTADFTTSDGTGTGTFTSAMTGLSGVTAYYVRAYATNSYGTSYGNEETFTTLCGTISNFPYSQNFDSWTTSSPAASCTGDGTVALEGCWTNVTGDGIDWDIFTGSTASTGTGPTADHTTGSGNYLYTESSSTCTGIGYITSPTFDLTSLSDATLTFWYNMYGTAMQTMNVDVSTDGGSTWTTTPIWTLSGDQGTAWIQATVDLTSYVSFNNLVIRWTGDLSGNTSYTSDMAIDDVSLTGTLAPTAINWTGAVSTDWQTAGNWDSGTIPLSTEDVIIPGSLTNYPVIDDGIATVAVCDNLTIELGASLTIDPDGYMTVSSSITNNAGNTGLVINSDATGTGSLIQNSTAGVDATVNCYLDATTNQWHMIASPVAAAPFTVLPSSSNLYYYNESTADYWTGTTYDAGSINGWTAPSVNMLVGTGYIFNYYSNTISYTGQLNPSTSTSSLSVPYTNNGVTAPNGTTYDDFDGWTLLGNPYTSAIDWDNAAVAHAAANLNDAVYCYDDKVTHDYTSYVAGVGTNGGTQYIPAMQGFFVKSDNTETGGTLNIGAAARVHNAQGFWKSNYTTPDDFIRLQISANGYSDETVVRFLPNATDKMDNGLDAYKLYTLENYVPQICSKTQENTEYSINTVKTLDYESYTVPVRFFQTGADYTLNITEFNFTDMTVYLKDNLNNTMTELSLNKIINLSADKSDATDRFELAFEKSSSSVLLSENANVSLFPNPTNGKFRLSVGRNIPTYSVKIMTVTGQNIFEQIIKNNNTYELDLTNKPGGIYFVKITFGDNSSVTKKIVKE